MKKTICIMCIVIGMGVIFYPHIKEVEKKKQQEDLLRNLELITTRETIVIGHEPYLGREELEADKKWLRKFELDLKEGKKNEKDNEPQISMKSKDENKSVSLRAVASIGIEKIDLELPLLKGATKENLGVAPSIMRESSEFGEIGNVSIAGHRSYTYGMQFNRLDEIVLGDEIVIKSDDKVHVYVVNKKKVVEPDELWVLEGNGKDKMITLITCTPIRVGSHRLILQGVLKEEE